MKALRYPALAPATRVLGLDASFSATGWAVGSLDAAPTWGTFKPCRGEPREQLAAFWNQLSALIGRYNFKICWFEHQEAIIPGQWGGGKQTNLSEGSRFRLQAAIELAGHIARFETYSVPENAWRKTFLGLARAPEHGRDIAGSGRAWLKARAVSECERCGWAARNDNEADALGVLVHGLTQMSPEYAARMAGPLTRYPRRPAA